MTKMQRLQFYIDPDDNRRLQKLADRLQVSKAQLIREGVKKMLKEATPRDEKPAYKLPELINEDLGVKDLGRNHDRYIYGGDTTSEQRRFRE